MLNMMERQIIIKFFNNGGYVLDFSNDTFANFTISSIGIDVQKTYDKSKGASLENYIMDASDEDAIRLTKKLIEYFQIVYGSSDRDLYLSDHDKKDEYSKILKILKDKSNSSILNLTKIDFAQVNNDEYLDKLIKELERHSETNPSAAIGESKDLLEAIFKRILEHYDISYDKNEDMNKLSQKVNQVLNLSAKGQDKSTDIGFISAKILGNLSQIEVNLTNLRNSYGSGHGRGHNQAGADIIPKRYAQLAVGSTITVINFLIETVKYNDAK